MLQLLHCLVVAALVALAAVHGSAQANTQDAIQLGSLSPAIACAESPLSDRHGAATLQSRPYSDPQAALDLEDPEREGDQELPPFALFVLQSVACAALPTPSAADASLGPVTGWKSARTSACHPRGPPSIP